MLAMHHFVAIACLLLSLSASAALQAAPTAPRGGTIPVTDANVVAGLSPYNWICKDDRIATTVCGAWINVGFKGTHQVVLQVSTESLALPAAARYPILAWTVNGGPAQAHQLAAGERAIVLAKDVQDPVIDLYVKGMSPFEDRWSGEIPPNAVTITGFAVDDGGATQAAKLPKKVWLNIGDSILSGDGAAYAERQGRPKNDLWAESDDGRASYGHLLAKHYGYRESRIAYGGYNWRGGLAKIPALDTLIDQRSAGASRLSGEMLVPATAVALINLGTNGKPREQEVTAALEKLRRRAGKETRILVMIPVSGAARAEVTAAFNVYKAASKDDKTHLIDLGKVTFPTADGVHPTAAGHQAIFEAAVPVLDAVLGVSSSRPERK